MSSLDITKLQSPVALVTGANGGIGVALCRKLLEKGYSVLAVCRTNFQEIEKLAQESPKLMIAKNIDVCNEEQLKELRAKISHLQLALLVNNAGICIEDTLETLDFDDFQKQFEVNTMAPLKVAKTFRSCLVEGSKIINISSRCGSLHMTRTDKWLNTGSDIGYHASKAALNMIGLALANGLKEHKIAVANVHPGYVQTKMNDGDGDLTPSESAEGIVRVIDVLTLETSGLLWNAATNPPSRLLD